MPDTPPEPAVPARLKRVLLDALVDSEQVQRRLDAACLAAIDMERCIENAISSGLIEPDGKLFEHCRELTSAAGAAQVIADRITEHVGKLR